MHFCKCRRKRKRNNYFTKAFMGLKSQMMVTMDIKREKGVAEAVHQRLPWDLKVRRAALCTRVVNNGYHRL